MPQTNTKTILDAQMVNAVIQATTEVLSTMMATETSFKGVHANTDYKPQGDISAVISISGEAGEGMFALSFSRSLANLMVARLIGLEPEHVTSEDLCDGVGEMVNMISGHTKATLSQASGQAYTLSLPTVIQGKDHEISSRPRNNPYLVVMFETEQENFYLQVSFKQF
jgi:CheY-specific phosphatase CheX